MRLTKPGATISDETIHHGINANVIHKWLPIYRNQLPGALPAFVRVQAAPKRATKETVIISLPLRDKPITVKWPASDLNWFVRYYSCHSMIRIYPIGPPYRAHGHVCRHWHCTSPGGCFARCGKATIRLSLCQRPDPPARRG
jgi:hypothetical protein